VSIRVHPWFQPILQKYDNSRGQFWHLENIEIMKTKFGVLIFLLAAAVAHAQTNNLTALLQQGLFEEQANRNLDAAIADYQALARQFDKDRQLAATAVFRLGECYRMQGKTNEAAAEYQRILRDFSDQTTLATLSRQDLTGMGMSPAPGASAALQQQRDLLAKQIALADQDLTTTQQMFQAGQATPGDVRAAQSKVLRLKQQLAALDSGVRDLPDLAVHASSEEDQEIQRIQTMIQNSPDLINAPDSHGQTPLEKAAINGWLKVATFLLDHGANVNSHDGLALPEAAQAGNRTMVEFLLAHGANINARNYNNETALDIAVQHGFEAVTRVLLANKADVNVQNPQGNTALYIAAQGDQTNIIQMLLAAGAKVNVENNEGRTPLSSAAERGKTETVQMLLEAKADPNAGRLDAPLLCAIDHKRTAVAQMLLEAGANPNAKGEVDWQPSWNWRAVALFQRIVNRGLATPLWLAVKMDQLPMVQLLLKFKADPNDSQTDGRPLLFSALSDTNILEALLDAGAKVDARDTTASVGNNSIQNWTPLLLAVENNSPVDTVEILLKHGANPNARDSVGNTPLHWMAGWGFERLPNRKVLQLLLDYKADPNVRNSGGITPLDELKQWSAQNNLSPEQKTSLAQLADLLRQHGALEVLPDWDRITVSRPSARYSAVIFYEGTNDWNQFTLFDLLGVQYDLLTASPGGATRVRAMPYGGSERSVPNSLSFPDFTRIVIHRPSASGTNWNELKINLARALDSGDCTGDVPLQFGDVVEIPEADHVINESWHGLSTNELFTLKNCLTRHLQITVNGQTTNLTIAPQVWELVPGSRDYPLSSLGAKMPPAVGLLKFEPFMLWPVLRDSKLLLASSDLSRITVKRRDATTAKTHEWTVDCSNPNSPPNFWLRDGDVIEVPAK
jgi:uncharacterized protein